MDTQRWQQLKALFDDALGYPPDERMAFVERMCDDDELRREALSLLGFYEDEPEFLESPVHTDALRVVAEESTPTPSGVQIGPYRLVREIGRGGMGTVYLAERADGQFQQQVAIKLVRHGRHQADLLHRLRRERQILASLQHPNIARLLAGGVTEDGLPYLVMEYIEGLPIDTYCDRHGLTISDRLILFRTVCAAVHYAHQNLVVHRDLKPSNIFVTRDGQVKLLDFGIAKLLEEDRVEAVPMTRTGMRAMTPEYASPEQVRGEPVTTASDVYALGVVLYLLLTGQRPYEVHNLPPTQVERIICEHEPPRPSTVAQPGREPNAEERLLGQVRHTERLARRLRGDLDTIVMMALRKEPGRRYGSVEQFSEDLRRHLAQLPVAARPDTLGYQVSTFVRRHTVGVVATLLVVLALVGGIIGTATQARIAAAERDRAEERFDDVRSLANTMLFDVHDAIRDLPGTTPVREMLVQQAHAYLDTLAHDVTPEPALQHELAEAYTRVGEIQGDPHFPNLGDLTGATEHYREALALRRALWERDSTAATQQALARSLGRLAVTLSWGGANDQAITLSRRALDLLAPLDTADATVRHDLGRIRSELGWWYVWAGQPEEGLNHLAQAEALLTPLAAHHPNNLDLQLDYWRVFTYQSDGLWFSGREEAALQVLRERVLPQTRTFAERHPLNPRTIRAHQSCLKKIANLEDVLGRHEDALATYRAALALYSPVIDSTDTRSHAQEAGTYHGIGDLLVKMNRLEEAESYYEEAHAIRQRLHDLDPSNGEAGFRVASTLRALCTLKRRANQFAEALAYCEQAIPVQEAAVRADPKNGVGQGALNTTYVVAARLHGLLAHRLSSPTETRRHHYTAALALYAKSLATIKAMMADSIAWSTPALLDSITTERDALIATRQ